MKLLQINPSAGTPDCWITAADGAVCPAYEVRERIIDGVFTWTWYAHHPTEGVHAVTPDRLGALYSAGRVSTTDPRPAPAPVRKPSRRLSTIRQIDNEVPLRERLRRLLNARCKSLQELRGDDHDDTRHDAVADATNGRTDSSMNRGVTEDEMGHAVSFVEDRLYDAGFDFEAEDAAYWQRRAERDRTAYRMAA